MVRRIADKERHALFEPRRRALPPDKSQLLRLQHMDVLMLHDVRGPRLRRQDHAPVEHRYAALQAATKRAVALAGRAEDGKRWLLQRTQLATPLSDCLTLELGCPGKL